MKNVIILGGYGKAGRTIAELLVDMENIAITLAGRDGAMARIAARQINKTHRISKVEGIALDAHDELQVKSIIPAYDLLVVAMPYSDQAPMILSCALDYSLDYIDIIPHQAKNAFLQSRSKTIKDNGLTYIIEAGAIPGIPGFLAHYAHERYGPFDIIELSGRYRTNDLPSGGASDVLEFIRMPARYYKDGQWHRASIRSIQKITFPAPWGTSLCFPIQLAEIIELPELLEVEEIRQYHGGINPATDTFLALWKFGLHNIMSRSAGKYILRKTLRCSQRPFGGVFQIKGTAQGVSRTVSVWHDDLYRQTAIPVVVALEQIIKSKAKKGVHYMGRGVEPVSFMNRLLQLGYHCQINTSNEY